MSDAYRRKRTFYQDVSTTAIVAATDDYSSTAHSFITPRNASYTIYIQKITVNPTTYSAKSWTFQDSAGTPVVYGIMSFPAAAPTTGGITDQFVLDFGPSGQAMTLGKDFQLKMSAAGVAGSLIIEAYQVLTSAVGAGSGTTN